MDHNMCQEMFYLQFLLEDSFFDNSQVIQQILNIWNEESCHVINNVILLKREYTFHYKMPISEELWLERYHDNMFFKLFRMKKVTFHHLLGTLKRHDIDNDLIKKYKGGRYPVSPEKSLLVFLWYISNQDVLISIGDRFGLVPSTVMNIVNVILYILAKLKKKYIFWPNSEEEFASVASGFKKFPGAIGAVDGCHISLKVPNDQHDSYQDRYLGHSINLMAICSASKIFTYVFIGFPGSAHDSRVFSNCLLYKQIEQHGPTKYFPNEDYHILGDSAFPLRTWLMVPFKKHNVLTKKETNFNYLLSSERVAIENTFGILKGRWRRLLFINTYSVSKAIEIVTAACILHNFCYLNCDEWEDVIVEENISNNVYINSSEEVQYQLGRQKRDRISTNLNNIQ